MECTCAHCGKQFEPQNKHHTYKYCSKSCFKAAMKKRSEKLTDKEKQTIRAMAENRLSVAKAARAMYYDQQTVRERCGNIQRKTGLDCREFYDVVKLLEMIKEGE